MYFHGTWSVTRVISTEPYGYSKWLSSIIASRLSTFLCEGIPLGINGTSWKQVELERRKKRLSNVNLPGDKVVVVWTEKCRDLKFWHLVARSQLDLVASMCEAWNHRGAFQYWSKIVIAWALTRWGCLCCHCSVVKKKKSRHSGWTRRRLALQRHSRRLLRNDDVLTATYTVNTLNPNPTRFTSRIETLPFMSLRRLGYIDDGWAPPADQNLDGPNQSYARDRSGPNVNKVPIRMTQLGIYTSVIWPVFMLLIAFDKTEAAESGLGFRSLDWINR